MRRATARDFAAALEAAAQHAKAASPAPKQRPTATTAQITAIDPAAQREEARRLAPLSATDRAKIVAAARALRERIERPVARDAKPRPIEVDAKEIAAPLSPSGADGDIEALAFLVLMQAAKSAQEDLKSIMAQVKAMLAKHMTLAQVKAARPTRDYDSRYGATSGAWTTDMFVEAVYRSLSR